MNLERSLKLLTNGATLVLGHTGYGIKRQVKSGDLAGQYVTYRISKKTAKALEQRGYQPIEQFIY